MILAQELRNQMAFALDAEGSDHYRDDTDYIPAINAAIKWVTNIISVIAGEEKFTEEILRDLTHSGVFKTSNLSRISLSSFPNEVWTIMAVYPKPSTMDNGNTTPPTNDENKSYYMSNFVHVSSDFSCKRLSLEEWATNKENPLEYGYDGDAICDSLKTYAYLNPVNYNSTISLSDIEVRPAIKNNLVTVFWVKKPTEITSLNDYIEFPDVVFQFLFNKALNFIAYKQGDGTNLFEITAAEIATFVTSIKIQK